MDFKERRRQPFLTEKQYSNRLINLNALFEGLNNELTHGDNDNEDIRGLRFHLANDGYNLFSLNYTAGEPIAPMRQQLEQIVIAYENYTKALRIHEQDEDWAPFYFTQIDEYERCMQLIGLCYLLHRRDLLPRIAAMQDRIYHDQVSETDTLYEDLLAFELSDRYDVDQWRYDDPYRPLIFSTYRDTPEESIADIKAYCDLWYPAMKSAPWHDQHQFEDGAYFGYWAFEAGAMAYLLDLDDSSIDHMVYPKDLVAFARSFDPRNDPSLAPKPNHHTNVQGGKPCP